MIELGFQPDTLSVTLVKGADFGCTLVNKDDNDVDLDWAAGTTITMRFGDPVTTTWTATIVGAEATFSEDKAAVDTLIAAITGSAHRRVSLHYVNGTDDFCWAKGTVKVNA